MDCSVSAEAEALVPLDISSGEVAVSAAELRRTHRTLRLTLVHHSEETRESSVVASISAWEVHAERSGDAQEQEGQQVEQVLRHCERRQHESACAAIFALAREDCMSAADSWISIKSTASAEGSSFSALGESACGDEKLERALVVESLGPDRAQLKLSDSLSLTLTVEAQERGEGGAQLPWAQHALRCCLARAQQLLFSECGFDGSSAAGQQHVSSAGLHAHVEDIWVERGVGAAAAQTASGNSSKTSRAEAPAAKPKSRLLRPVLSLLRAKFHRHRARTAIEAALKQWGAWGCWPCGPVTAVDQPSSQTSSRGAALRTEWGFAVVPLAGCEAHCVAVRSSSSGLATVDMAATSPIVSYAYEVCVDSSAQLMRALQLRLLAATVW